MSTQDCDHAVSSSSKPQGMAMAGRLATVCFSFQASQYNMLAADLAQNLKPWYWYGVRGVVPNQPYTGDMYDKTRIKTFGYGRSKALIQLWSVAKSYFKLFDTEKGYPYQLQRRSLYQQHDEGPSIAMKHGLEAAIFDFFHRNDQNNPRGDRYLAYHLFESPDKQHFKVVSTALLEPLGYTLTPHDWLEAKEKKDQIITSYPGSPTHTTAIDAFNKWLRRTLVIKRREHHHHHYHHVHHTQHPEKKQQQHVPGGIGVGGIGHVEFALSDERVEQEFHEVSLELATFMSLSDDDLHRLIEHQHVLDWKNRGDEVVKQIFSMKTDLLGLEEVDRIEDLKVKLNKPRVQDQAKRKAKGAEEGGKGQEEEKEGGRRLELAIFKRRKVRPYDDGCALFYNPAVFRLRRKRRGGLTPVRRREEEAGGEREGEGREIEEGGEREDGLLPAVAVIRYSAEAELEASNSSSLGANSSSSSNRCLPIYLSKLSYQDGIAGCEDIYHSHPRREEKGGVQKGGSDKEGKQEEKDEEEKEGIDLFSFTRRENLQLNKQDRWDERVAVVGLFEHIASNQAVLAVSTHLAHSQDDAEAEWVRACQVRQLDQALGEIQRHWGLEEDAEGEGGGTKDLLQIIMMDGNDTPHLSHYGAHRTEGHEEKYTPMYRTMVEELGWVDCLGEDYGPTSVTLSRRYRIDYIFTKVLPLIKGEASPSLQLSYSFLPALHVRLAGLDPSTGQKVLIDDLGREEKEAVYGLPLPFTLEDQPPIPSDHLHASVKVMFATTKTAKVSI